MDCIPCRLFVHNLFFYCNCQYEDLLDKLNDEVISEIQYCITRIRGLLSEKNCELPNSFTRFVKNMNEKAEKKLNLKLSKSPDHCLFKYLKQIRGVISHIESRKFCDTVTGCNTVACCTTLDEFERSFKVFHEDDDKCGTISLRNLRLLFDKNLPSYNKNQSDIISYLLINVFPKMKNPQGTSLIMLLEEVNPYCNIAFTDLELKISHDTTAWNTNDLTDIRQLFEELFDFKETQYQEIGNQFYKIYMELNKLYENMNTDSTNDLLSNNLSQHEMAKSQTAKITEYDSVISTHIMGFMRWIPMISADDYDIKLLISVENIIDIIRDKVLAEATKNCTKEKFFKNSHNLFLSEQNSSLRKLLISAMHNETLIHSQFHKYYEFIISCAGRVD